MATSYVGERAKEAQKHVQVDFFHLQKESSRHTYSYSVYFLIYGKFYLACKVAYRIKKIQCMTVTDPDKVINKFVN